MLGPRDWQSRHAVVAIPENLNSQTLILLCDLIEAAKEFVQRLHQITGRQLLGQWSEIDNVRVQYGDVVVPLHMQLVEACLLSPHLLASVCHLQHYTPFNLSRNVRWNDGEQELLLLLPLALQLDPLLDSDSRAIHRPIMSRIRHDPVIQSRYAGRKQKDNFAD